MRLWTLAVLLSGGLMTSACGRSGEAHLPTFEHAVRGDRVDTASFVAALRRSFRAGSTAQVSFDVRGGAGLRGRGAVRYTAHDMDANLRVADWKLEGGTIDIRTIGGITYMRVPESRGLWVDLTDAGPGAPGADLAADADPRGAIGDLRANVQQIRFGGTENVGGVRARRFEVVTRPPAPASGAADATSEPGHPAVTEYWFDRHGRVVRRESELRNAGSATFTWTGWGKPVTIERPRKGTVVTLKRLRELGQQESATAR
jgi:hypothetical protein